jgi:glycosyltransferase involved in cell wall biosynthesis
MNEPASGVTLSLSAHRDRWLSGWLSDIDFALAPSESRLRYLLRRSARPLPGAVVLNVRRQKGASREAVPELDRHPVGKRPVKVVHAGRLSPAQMVRQLVEALPHIRADVGLVLAGGGDEGYRAELQQLITTLGVGERCALLPRLSRSVVDALVARCDVGAVMYEPTAAAEARDPAPNKIGDYAAHGLAMIGTRQPYMQHWLDDRGLGRTVESVDAPTLGRALDELTQPETLARARETSRAAFASELNMSHQLDVMLALAERVRHDARKGKAR